MFTPLTARIFVACTWYDTDGLSKNQKLSNKARELISGDRAEMCIFSGDTTRIHKLLQEKLHETTVNT